MVSTARYCCACILLECDGYLLAPIILISTHATVHTRHLTFAGSDYAFL